MFAAAVFAILLATAPSEPLPIDARMAEYEAAMPRLAEVEALTEEEIGRLGPPESGWATSGLSAASAIAAARGNAEQHVLGEWDKGGHGVTAPGDRPLAVPQGQHRYAVRDYDGAVDYHAYHRLPSGIVIHSFGRATRIGNAECRPTQGIELIARDPWRRWSEETALLAFAIARATRDDPRTYCLLYRPAENGRFVQLAYASDGRPYTAINEDGQAFVMTSRAEAAARIFGTEGSPRTTE
jgi:hypothetical protein